MNDKTVGPIKKIIPIIIGKAANRMKFCGFRFLITRVTTTMSRNRPNSPQIGRIRKNITKRFIKNMKIIAMKAPIPQAAIAYFRKRSLIGLFPYFHVFPPNVGTESIDDH